MPSTVLPSYVILDQRSQWHVSGLLSTALESMTLPSRLKAKRESLDELANALNVNGNQNIAKLRMSIDQQSALNGIHESENVDTRGEGRDRRMPSQVESAGDASIEEDLSVFDIDFFPAEAADQSRGRRRNIKKAHVFGQAETYRGDDENVDHANKVDEGQQRARRRAAGLPIIHK